MIVREFLDDPLLPFDYYNDYKDTMGWLKWMAAERQPNGSVRDQAKVAVGVLEKGWADYVAGLHHRG